MSDWTVAPFAIGSHFPYPPRQIRFKGVCVGYLHENEKGIYTTALCPEHEEIVKTAYEEIERQRRAEQDREVARHMVRQRKEQDAARAALAELEDKT